MEGGGPFLGGARGHWEKAVAGESCAIAELEIGLVLSPACRAGTSTLEGAQGMTHV